MTYCQAMGKSFTRRRWSW